MASEACLNRSTTATEGSKTINLKILIDKKNNKVVMAETDSDFANILFSFLTMPMGTIVRLISKQPQPAIIGSMTSLYKGVEKLEDQLLQTQACKSMLLHPRNPYENECRRLKLNIDDTEPTKYYICADWNCSRRGDGGLYSTFKNARCNCGKLMDNEINWLKIDVAAKPEEDGGVFVCGMTKFMVTDDLQVEPISPAAILTQLLKLGLKETSSLQETTLSIGSEEILTLLKGSLLSKTTLTDVFLRKQGFTSEGLKFGIGDAVQSQGLFGSTTPAPAATPAEVMSVKLIISKSMNKALYAEAGEDMVDFLLSFLTFPLGSILQLLGGNSSLGSMDNLYKSVQQSKAIRDDKLRNLLLYPRLYRGFGCRSNLLSLNETEQPPTSLWCTITTPNQQNEGSLASSGIRHSFSSYSSYGSYSSYSVQPLHLVNPKSPTGDTAYGGGFLKGLGTLVVTDNLVFTPLVSMWSLSFFKSFDVPLDDLEVRMVKVGREQVSGSKVFKIMHVASYITIGDSYGEIAYVTLIYSEPYGLVMVKVGKALRLLKASLLSDSALTDVFINFGLKIPKQEE